MRVESCLKEFSNHRDYAMITSSYYRDVGITAPALEMCFILEVSTAKGRQLY